jgi:hypothetical protein
VPKQPDSAERKAPAGFFSLSGFGVSK